MQERGAASRAAKFSKHSVCSLKYKNLQLQKVTTFNKISNAATIHYNNLFYQDFFKFNKSITT